MESRLHSFHAAEGQFPPGIKASSRFSQSLPYEWVYFIHYLLPQLELENYYAAIDGPTFNLQNPWLASALWPSTVDKSSFSFLLCPSDALGGVYSPEGSGVSLPKSNYLGFFSGLRDSVGFGTSISEIQRAVFRVGKGTSLAEVKDGTSNTMAVAEYLKGVAPTDPRGSFWTNRAGCQALYVTLGPNSTAPDDICNVFCPTGESPNEPDMNLPCVGTDRNDASYASPPQPTSGRRTRLVLRWQRALHRRYHQ